jgi:hypothetical protein
MVCEVELPEGFSQKFVELMDHGTFEVKGECLYLLMLLLRRTVGMAEEMFDAGILVCCPPLVQPFPQVVLCVLHVIALRLAKTGRLDEFANQVRGLEILDPRILEDVDEDEAEASAAQMHEIECLIDG